MVGTRRTRRTQGRRQRLPHPSTSGRTVAAHYVFPSRQLNGNASLWKMIKRSNMGAIAQYDAVLSDTHDNHLKRLFDNQVTFSRIIRMPILLPYTTIVCIAFVYIVGPAVVPADQRLLRPTFGLGSCHTSSMSSRLRTRLHENPSMFICAIQRSSSCIAQMLTS